MSKDLGTGMCISKFKKAQHIVEFALIAPFIIFFFGAILEIALIVHTNYKFTASLYEAISFMALNNKINIEKEETVENIKEYAKILLKHRFAPYKDSLDIELVQAGDVDFLIGKYRYTSTFTIFNNMAGFEPDSYNFLSVIPVNSAILRKNSFDLSDETLEKMMQGYYNGSGGEPSSSDDFEKDTDSSNKNEDETADEGEMEILPDEEISGENKGGETFDIQVPEVSLQ